MMAYSRLQSLQALKSARQRLSVALMLVMLTAMTAWADTENLSGYDDITGSCVPVGSSYDTNVIYTLHDEDQNGHYEQLTISGTGDMIDFGGYEELPWKDNLDDITSVTVQSGVTHIAASAFHRCRYLTSVSLPEGLTSIGDRAFNTCLRLPALTVPASVESVGEKAFYDLAYNINGCTLTFASGSMLTSVGENAFLHAKASVDMSACTSLTSVPMAFDSFNGTVTFPNSLTSIAAGCFDYCKPTTKVYVLVPDNYVLTVNGESVSATDGKADITSNIGVGTEHPAVTLSYTPYSDHFSQEGNTYTILDAAGWGIFCDALQDNNSYDRFSGKTVYLDDNITVTRMAGSDGHEFSGTFDGDGNTLTVSYGTASVPLDEDYIAPFRYVSGATISGLHVSGNIYTSHVHAGGIIGLADGTTNVTDCRSSVNIVSSINGDGTHGGLIACTWTGSTTNIEGCIFDGSIQSATGFETNCCGGFVGWRNNIVNVTNCLLTADLSTIGVGNTYPSCTFVRNGLSTITNSYYTHTLGTAQGKAPYSATAAPVGTPTAETYTVSGITAYSNGLTRTIGDDVTFFYGGGDNVSVSYVNEYGTSDTHEAIALDGTEISLTTGWYFVGKDITYTIHSVNAGDVTIILADGCTMSVGNKNNTNNNHRLHCGSLTIYGQSGQSGTLNVYNNSTNNDKAPIYVSDFYAQHGGIVNLDATLNLSIALYGIATITGGTLTAKGKKFVNLTVSGGTVSFTGGIQGSLTISGGTVSSGGDILGDATISGGTVSLDNVTGIDFSGGDLTVSGTVQGATLSWTSATDRIYVNCYDDDVTIALGKTFYDEDGYSYSGDNVNIPDGKTLRPYDYRLTLSNDADNSTAIDDANGKVYNVTLAGRTLYKDGDWNTLCLPFDLGDPNASTNHWFDDTPLEGATVMTLANSPSSGTGFDATTGTLTLYFVDATKIEAGVPYIVKWPATEPNYIENPVFQGVTVENELNNVTFSGGAFKGNYNYTEWAAGTAYPSILLLGENNTLFWPDGQAATKLGACRAYFELSNGQSAREFVLNFDGDTTTGISLTPDPSPTGEGSDYYTLDGRKLSGKPTAKGVYIVNGRKVVMK